MLSHINYINGHNHLPFRDAVVQIKAFLRFLKHFAYFLAEVYFAKNTLDLDKQNYNIPINLMILPFDIMELLLFQLSISNSNISTGVNCYVAA